jgi:hypothetical protein
MFLHQRLFNYLFAAVAMKRPPDFIVGGAENPYLYRWYLTPWSSYDRVKPPLWAQFTKRLLPNIYLHKFMRSDDDRALHDHPWFNLSFLLNGSYIEETIHAGGVKGRTRRNAGDWKVRSPWASHRVELLSAFNAMDQGGKVLTHTLDEVPCWTLFCTSPRVREWGFHCPDAGWIVWTKFVSVEGEGNVNNIGKGCNQ